MPPFVVTLSDISNTIRQSERPRQGFGTTTCHKGVKTGRNSSQTMRYSPKRDNGRLGVTRVSGFLLPKGQNGHQPCLQQNDLTYSNHCKYLYFMYRQNVRVNSASVVFTRKIHLFCSSDCSDLALCPITADSWPASLFLACLLVCVASHQ